MSDGETQKGSALRIYPGTNTNSFIVYYLDSTDSKLKKAKGAHFMCSDTRTLAHFSCEPVDLSDSEFCQPFYRRAISILEKIEAEPGIDLDTILNKFTVFQKENISPPLTPVLSQVLLEALEDMDYIVIQDNKARATGRQPPSRPRVG